MIRGVGNEVMSDKTEYIGLSFYKPRDHQYDYSCNDLRIVQYNGYTKDFTRLSTRMSWDFPDVQLRLSGHVPANIETISINLHWRDADMLKAAYSLNKSDQLVVEVYFGNMSENDRNNKMIVNTVTFSPKISLPKAKKEKYLHLRVNETIPFDSTGSSLITINNHWGRFWDDTWIIGRQGV